MVLEFNLPPKFRGAIRRNFIEVIVAEGKGTEEDCIREVHYFIDEEGKLKFTEDPNGKQN
jgi:hypothetical protein